MALGLQYSTVQYIHTVSLVAMWLKFPTCSANLDFSQLIAMGYNIYTHPLKVVGTHPNAGANVRVVGHKDGYWLVDRLDGSARFAVSAQELKFIPHEWRTAARVYDSQRLMTYFEGPGNVDEWRRFKANDKDSPPNCDDTLAFWGHRTFTYIFDASKLHSYGSNTSANCWFWDPSSRIFGGIVWSDCNPWADKQHINSKMINYYGFQWWPCIFSITMYGQVYMKCQDFAFTRGRPRLCDISRLIAYTQFTGPVHPNPVQEEIPDDEDELESDLADIYDIYEQDWTRISPLGSDCGSGTPDMDGSTDAGPSSSGSSSTATTPSSLLSSSCSLFSFCMPQSSLQSWPSASSRADRDISDGDSQYEIIEF